MAIIQSRRWFIAGLGATLFAAPAIVRVASLMPAKALVPVYDASEIGELLRQRMYLAYAEMSKAITSNLHGDGGAIKTWYDEPSNEFRHVEISSKLIFRSDAT